MDGLDASAGLVRVLSVGRQALPGRPISCVNPASAPATTYTKLLNRPFGISSAVMIATSSARAASL